MERYHAWGGGSNEAGEIGKIFTFFCMSRKLALLAGVGGVISLIFVCEVLLTLFSGVNSRFLWEGKEGPFL